MIYYNFHKNKFRKKLRYTKLTYTFSFKKYLTKLLSKPDVVCGIANTVRLGSLPCCRCCLDGSIFKLWFGSFVIFGRLLRRFVGPQHRNLRTAEVEIDPNIKNVPHLIDCLTHALKRLWSYICAPSNLAA